MYHIVRNVPDDKNFWFYVYISKKLKCFRWFLRDIVKYSAFDVELDMRLVYQCRVMGGATDHGHAAWNEYLKGSSLVYGIRTDFKLNNVEYLNKLAYLVALKRITSIDRSFVYGTKLNFLDLATGSTHRSFEQPSRNAVRADIVRHCNIAGTLFTRL
ncbi:unnamed protein product [Macrosiphum euphorbiae]|uniref:Uncharacterized protein n=1 Tax=Macrosiphum euphorbiae TaxID=13131 RepID=A0AAV0XV07_9HEMI|nr:unnamed protein product [Macrosiphum euphorbiae]